ncbi:MAG: DUF4345 domain-containing protein [Actinomycetota bacterium]
MNMTDRPHSPATSANAHLPGRRAWQAVFLVLALIPLASSILALAIGTERFVGEADVDPALDSTYRYFGGIYLGVALLALWCVARIEQRADALVFVTGSIFLGGVGRLLSIVDVGIPATSTAVILVIELGAVVLALAMRRQIRVAPPLAG